MRILKQIIYFLVYLAILGGVFWGVKEIFLIPPPSCFDNRQNQSETGVDCGGTCISCQLKQLQPIEIKSQTLFSGDRSYSAAAEVSNPNADFAVKFFKYSLTFFDNSGNELEVKRGDSFIYAGKSRYIIEAARITSGIPSRASLKIEQDSIEWIEDSEIVRPPYEIKDASAILENGLVAVSGNVVNLNSYPVSRFDIGVFALNNSNKRIGVSKTEVKELRPFGIGRFKIFVPIEKKSLESLDLDKTARGVFVEVFK